MGACKDCKWWGVEYEGACDFVNTIHAAFPETHFLLDAKADDDSGLECKLMTGPYFGCLHFKEKGEEV